MEIIKEKYTLREWQLTDIESLLKNANNIHIWRNMTDLFPHPYTERCRVVYPHEYGKERLHEVRYSINQATPIPTLIFDGIGYTIF